jgi:hypothetical protein
LVESRHDFRWLALDEVDAYIGVEHVTHRSCPVAFVLLVVFASFGHEARRES